MNIMAINVYYRLEFHIFVDGSEGAYDAALWLEKTVV